MKRIVLLLAVLPLVLAAAIRPKNVIAELATSTTCGYCPHAYAGLEVMKDRYPVPDLACIRYYSGTYGNQEASARSSYYGVSGIPHCVFNGQDVAVGGGDATADGSRYDPIVSRLLTEGTPFWVNVALDISGSEGTATTTLTLFGDYSGATPKLRVALIEDDVSGNHTNITRSVVDVDDVTITNEGQEQVLGHVFELDGEWNTDNLYAVAFLQVNNTKEVLQSGSSYPRPDYHYRLTAPCRIDRIDPSGSFSSSFYVTNVGAMTDDFIVTLDDLGLPSGWSATLNSVALANVSLDSDESAEFEIEINPNGNAGAGDAIIEVSSSSGGEDYDLMFRAITNDVDINLVDDDGGEAFEDYFTAALDAIGKTYGVWDIGMGGFHLENLADDMTPVLVWSCGWSFPSLDPDQRDLLRFYLNNGGKLFLTGQDIGWDLCSTDSDNSSADAKDFYNNYLHARYLNDDANNYNLTGVGGDPITDGMSFSIQGGDGADNQEYPSIIDPYDAAATTILEYSTSDGCAIRAEDDDYRVVYLAFGYEAIDNATDRRNLLENALDWLGTAPPITALDERPPEFASVLLNVESLNTGTLIAFYNLPSPDGQLDVYDALGRRVAGTRLSETEGRVELKVNHLPSGCYFVRLKAGDATTSQKAVLLR